jgi:uncharacterized protein (TIGR04255 family)
MSMAESYQLKNPPVAEVAVVVQFDPVMLRNQDMFRLWSETKLRELYPEVTEYGELPPFFENFETGRDTPSPTLPPSGILRLNFRNLAIDEQFQVQRNRAGFYWQKREANREYPGHPVPLNTFLRDFGILSEFLVKNGHAVPQPNQCAMSYANRLVKGTEWNSRDDLPDVVTFLRHPGALDGLEIESLDTVRRYRLKNSKGDPIARVYVGLTESDIPDELDLEFIVRGPPAKKDMEAVTAFFNTAHDEIGRLFKVMTTEGIRKQWRNP